MDDLEGFQKGISDALGIEKPSAPVSTPTASGGLSQIKTLLGSAPTETESAPSKSNFSKLIDTTNPLPSPSSGMAQTTPQRSYGDPISAVSDFLFKQVPIKLQPAFNTPSEAVQTMGTKSMELAYNLLNRTPEFFAGLPAKLVATAFPGHGATLPFGLDAGRLTGAGGEPGSKTIQSFGQDYLDQWAKSDAEAGLTGSQVANPTNPRSLFNGTISAISNVIMPALATADVGNLAKGVTEEFLQQTGFQKTLGLKYSELANLPEDAFVNTVTKRTNEVVNGVFSDVSDGTITENEGRAQLAQIRDEYKNLGDLYKGRIGETGGSYTSLNKLGQAFEDVSIALNENVKNLGLRDYAPVEGMVRPAEQTLPGYKAEEGQAPAFGLSTQRVEPVGFGEDNPKVPNNLQELATEAQKYPDVKSFTDAYNKAYVEGRANPDNNYMDKNVGVPFGDTKISVSGTETPIKNLGGIEKFYQLATGKNDVVGTAKMGDQTIPIKKGGDINLPNEKSVQSAPEEVSHVTQDMFEQYSKAEADKELQAGSKANEAVDTVKNNSEPTKQEIEMMRLEKEHLAEQKDMNPGKDLQKYTSKVTGELPEVTGKQTVSSPTTGKQIKNSLFGKQGDNVVVSLGFKDLDSAQMALDTYKQQRDRLSQIQSNLSSKVKDWREKKQIVDAVEAKLRKEGKDRAQQVSLIQDFFDLSDSEFKAIMGKLPDLRLLPEQKFKAILDTIYDKAHDAFKLAEARMQVKATILDKELKKADNLRQAEKLPTFENMSLDQLHKFNDLMQTFKDGDEFLGVRNIETMKNTDLAEVKTHREILEDLAKRAGVSVNDLNQIKATPLDELLYDTALARRNPLFKIMVEDATMANLKTNMRFTQFKHELSDVMSEARASRKRSLLDRLIPTDDQIYHFLGATPEEKLVIMKTMTTEELKASKYIQDYYSSARDYLVQLNQLRTRFWDNYITHIPKTFLEILKNTIEVAKSTNAVTGEKIGYMKGIKEAFEAVISHFKQEEKIANILDQKTGQVLPLEKFMRFTLKREGFEASHDVVKAVTSYARAFETKANLDQIIPKLNAYVSVLTPQTLTPGGLIMDESLKTFFKEWMNSKKGRLSPRDRVRQGSILMKSVDAGLMITRIIDLGMNIPVGLASHIMGQFGAFTNLGPKDYALGVKRYATLTARSIEKQWDRFIRKDIYNDRVDLSTTKQYAGFVGETMLDKMLDESKSFGDKLYEGIFGLFSSASRKTAITYLLAGMTEDEFKSGKISAEHLTQIKLKMGKYYNTDNDSSIWQKSASGKIFYQYKKVFEPMLMTTTHNIYSLIKMLVNGDENIKDTDEFKEFMRVTLSTLTIVLLSYSYYDYLNNKKNKSFLETLAQKGLQHAMTELAVFTPSLYTKLRLVSFLDDIATSISQITSALATGNRTANGDIPGVSKLETTITPKTVGQLKTLVSGPSSSGSSSSSTSTKRNPALNRLSKLKAQLNRSNPGLNRLKALKTRLKLQ